MQVFVKLVNGQVKTIDVEAADTISLVKEKIAAETSVHPALQRVFHNGEELEDDRTAEHYGVAKEAELALAERPKPCPILLSVGGARFTTLLSTLTSHQGSLLAAMFDGVAHGDDGSAEGVPGVGLSGIYVPRGPDGRYFIDRDGSLFRYVLNYLRDHDSKAAFAHVARVRKAALESIASKPVATWGQDVVQQWATLIKLPGGGASSLALTGAFAEESMDGEELQHLRLKPLQKMLRRAGVDETAAVEIAQAVLAHRDSTGVDTPTEPEPEAASSPPDEEEREVVLPTSKPELRQLAIEADYFRLPLLAARCRAALEAPEHFVELRDFSGMDLTNHNFSGLDLSGAKFTGATVTGADFSGADLSRVIAPGVLTLEQTLSAARGGDFTGMDIRGQDLSGRDLTCCGRPTEVLLHLGTDRPSSGDRQPHGHQLPTCHHALVVVSATWRRPKFSARIGVVPHNARATQQSDGYKRGWGIELSSSGSQSVFSRHNDYGGRAGVSYRGGFPSDMLDSTDTITMVYDRERRQMSLWASASTLGEPDMVLYGFPDEADLAPCVFSSSSNPSVVVRDWRLGACIGVGEND